MAHSKLNVAITINVGVLEFVPDNSAPSYSGSSKHVGIELVGVHELIEVNRVNSVREAFPWKNIATYVLNEFRQVDNINYCEYFSISFVMARYSFTLFLFL